MLLQARVLVRMGDHAAAEVLVGELRDQAEVYKARGEVNLVEAENLIAQGRADEATPLLENMPEEWQVSPEVKARAQEILGHQYLARGEWNEARKAFRQALNRPKDLDDEEEVRRLSDHLNVFLAAIRAAGEATGPDLARNRLLMANSFRFGFERPNRAATYYRMAGRDTAAESTVAARALYGAYLTYRDVLDKPDSAAVFAAELDSVYPDSPQAYEARHGGSSNLLGYLLEMRAQEQAAAYAALSDSERVALSRGLDAGLGAAVPVAGPEQQLRRRMVYLQRRDHLLFPPTEAELALYERRLQELARTAARAAAADTAGATVPVATDPGPAGQGVPPPAGGAQPDGAGLGGAGAADAPTAAEAGPGAGETAHAGGQAGEQAGEQTGEQAGEPVGEQSGGEDDGEEEDDEEDDEEDQEEKKKDTFDLRAPGPRPGAGD
jgi:hypothetical protein